MYVSHQTKFPIIITKILYYFYSIVFINILFMFQKISISMVNKPTFYNHCPYRMNICYHQSGDHGDDGDHDGEDRGGGDDGEHQHSFLVRFHYRKNNGSVKK